MTTIIPDLDEIMAQRQTERTAAGTSVMTFGADGPVPLTKPITPTYNTAAFDPSLAPDVVRGIKFDAC